MKKLIDINTWKRKEHYNFFVTFTEPFFGVVANVDCKSAYNRAKEMGVSFMLYYLHKSLRAVNEIEEFRIRIENEQPYLYDVVHGGSTTMNADGLFAFSFLPFSPDFDTFYASAKAELDRIKTISGLNATPESTRIDLIQYSTVPWIHFTGLTHARNYNRPDSCPKISFGKCVEQDGKMFMPVALNANHALADGEHAGRYFELFQQYLNE